MGSALVRHLVELGHSSLLLRTHQQLDLTDRSAVHEFFTQERPEYVFVAAAKVGGILANSVRPAEFIYENLMIQTHVIQEAYRSGVERLLFLGSSCIYPRLAPQPLREEYLLTGPLEATNRPYAVAKIAGIEMCWAFNRQFGTSFIAAMPTNLYGLGEKYDLHNSHVASALIRKMHEAKVNGEMQVSVWGTGNARREFLFSDDAADACILLMNLPCQELRTIVGSDEMAPIVNIGFGDDITIRELTQIIAEVVNYRGSITFDVSKPDGTPRKLVNTDRIRRFGWRPRTSLRVGLARTYEDFCRRFAQIHTESPVAR